MFVSLLNEQIPFTQKLKVYILCHFQNFHRIAVIEFQSYIQMMVQWLCQKLFNPTVNGGGHYGPPPINFEASQLKQEGLFWFNLHTNLVTWVPTMAKTQKIFLDVNSV